MAVRTATIQSAINAAQPGDMIIIPAGTYSEMLLMWKPVRLQGVGAASSVLNADAQPAGKLLDPWRTQLVCLFGLTPDGRPNIGRNADTSCSKGWIAASGGPVVPTMIVDRLPFEAVLGWDATLNGNLAEQLIEPSLMGAYEGAGITVLGKGVNIQRGDTDPFGAAAQPADREQSHLQQSRNDVRRHHGRDGRTPGREPWRQCDPHHGARHVCAEPHHEPGGAVLLRRERQRA